MRMMITALTAPTRGPDYIAPVAPGGTPQVSRLAAVPVVATDPSPAAAPQGDDTTLAYERKKRLERAGDRAPPSSSRTKSSVAMPPLLHDIPLGGTTPRQAAHAYQSQRRAANLPPSADTIIIEALALAPMTPISRYPTAAIPGGLDVKA